MDPFDQKKQHILAEIAGNSPEQPDASPKGTIDTPVIPLITLINSHPDLVTTSSCSGRLSVFLEGEKLHQEADSGSVLEKVGGKGQGGKWLFVTHNATEAASKWWENSEIFNARHVSDTNSKCRRYLLLKYEPLILHVKTRDMETAAKLYNVAMSCGFRESGIGSNGVVGIRISLRIDTVIGVLNSGDEIISKIVSEDYLRIMNDVIQDRFAENSRRMDKLYRAIEQNMMATRPADQPKESKEERRKRKQAEGLKRKLDIQKEREARKALEDVGNGGED